MGDLGKSREHKMRVKTCYVMGIKGCKQQLWGKAKTICIKYHFFFCLSKGYRLHFHSPEEYLLQQFLEEF